jgi:glycosyltransferase involved in cell wall biosynthesis
MMLLAASLFGLLIWLPSAVALFSGMRRIESLEGVPPADDSGCPSLSVVVPACNEAATIEPALRSLLSLDYPGLELIVVDDRSTDGTGEIIQRLASRDPRVHALRVDSLPAGWLGKNHALHVGSQAASGDWILFTDADVVYQPDALRRVMARAGCTGSEHLVALPRLVVRGFWERLTVTYFMVLFNLRFRPWNVSDPGSAAYVGVGAFNLIHAASYRAFGGHAALPLEVADDVKLGKLMKANGARSGVVDGSERISVRWVVGLRGFVDGLTKNMFAGFEFRPGMSAAAIVVLLIGHVFPPFGLLAGGPGAVACALTLACMAWTAAVMAPLLERGAEGGEQSAGGSGQEAEDSAIFRSLPSALRSPPAALRSLPAAAWGLAFPLAALVVIVIVARSTWLTYRRGGVLWRGTLYPLEELRRGIV